MRRLEFQDKEVLTALQNTSLSESKIKVLSVLSGMMDAKELDTYIEDLNDAQYFLVQLNAEANDYYAGSDIADVCHSLKYLLDGFKQARKIIFDGKKKDLLDALTEKDSTLKTA